MVPATVFARGDSITRHLHMMGYDLFLLTMQQKRHMSSLPSISLPRPVQTCFAAVCLTQKRGSTWCVVYCTLHKNRVAAPKTNTTTKLCTNTQRGEGGGCAAAREQ